MQPCNAVRCMTRDVRCVKCEISCGVGTRLPLILLIVADIMSAKTICAFSRTGLVGIEETAFDVAMMRLSTLFIIWTTGVD